MIIQETLHDAIQFIHKTSQTLKPTQKISSIALEILKTLPKSRLYLFIDVFNQIFNQTTDFLLLGDLLEVFIAFEDKPFLMLDIDLRLYELHQNGYFISKIEMFIAKSICCVKKMVMENVQDDLEGFYAALEKSTNVSKSVWKNLDLNFCWFDCFIGKKVFKNESFHKIINAEVESQFRFPLLIIYQKVVAFLLKLIYHVDELGDMIDLYSLDSELDQSRCLQIGSKPLSITLIVYKLVTFLITQIFKVWSLTKASNNSTNDITSVCNTILMLFSNHIRKDPAITYKALLKSELTEPKIARAKYLSLKSKRSIDESQTMYQKIYQTVKDRVHTDKLSFLKSGVYLTVEQVYLYIFIRYDENKKVFNIGYTNTRSEPVLDIELSGSNILSFTEFKSERKRKGDYGEEWMRIYGMEEKIDFKLWIKLGTTKGDIVGYFRSWIELKEFKDGIVNLLDENQDFIKKKINDISLIRFQWNKL